ncbi:MAG: DUF4298 domain-containing protein, partial [Treponema sp.]|nr:DUF4298 domain-containing protein [Treponema sp.]
DERKQPADNIQLTAGRIQPGGRKQPADNIQLTAGHKQPGDRFPPTAGRIQPTDNIPQTAGRIRQMEDILDRGRQLMVALEEKLSEYREFQSQLSRLEEYYSSPGWKEDFALDETGLLPADLKRGVLSEDGIYDLLEQDKELRNLMQEGCGVRTGFPDCCFSVARNWFRCRTGAIIIEDDCFLAIRTSSAPHFYTVGGGIHLGEKSEDCVLREVQEETGVRYELDRLAAVCENLFIGREKRLEGFNCHVIEFYYLMKSRGSRDLHCESFGWNKEQEELVWIPLEKLPETNIKPDFLKTRLPEILSSKDLIHIVNDGL